MTLYENVISALILIALTITIYCKATNKTLPDFIKEMREIFSGPEEIAEGGIVK